MTTQTPIPAYWLVTGWNWQADGRYGQLFQTRCYSKVDAEIVADLLCKAAENAGRTVDDATVQICPVI